MLRKPCAISPQCNTLWWLASKSCWHVSHCTHATTRLMVGLLYLKHLHKLSDEQVVEGWLENPYWQYFCGESHFQTQWPIDPSSLTHYRQRIGEQGCEWLLQQTIAAGISSGAVRKSHLKRVKVDTTVQEKAVSFPTDSQLLNRSRQRLVRLCHHHGVACVKVMRDRVHDTCIGPTVMAMPGNISECAVRFASCTLILDGVVRDIERKIGADEQLQSVFADELGLARQSV